MSKEHLATYLNDHLAGSVVAIEMLDHLGTEASDLRAEIVRLQAEIEADRRVLKDLMDKLGIEESTTRAITGWVAEKLARVKAKVDDRTGGALHRLESLEVVALGIDGKLALWSALKAATEALQGVDLDLGQMERRARDQRRRIEQLRLNAAKAALHPAA